MKKISLTCSRHGKRNLHEHGGEIIFSFNPQAPVAQKVAHEVVF